MRRRPKYTTLIYDRECDVAGQDPKRIRQLAARLAALARDCDELGITIFGGTGAGSLRGSDANKPRGVHDRLLILADTGGPFDGGDGGYAPDEDDLNRGE